MFPLKAKIFSQGPD